MGKFLSIEEFEKRLSEEKIQGETAEYIRGDIERLTTGKRKRPRLRLAPILVWILLIAITTGFAVISIGNIELKNKSGKVSFFYTKQGDEWIKTDTEAEKIREKYYSIEEKLKRTLKPGEYMYFGIVEVCKAYEKIGSTAIYDMLQKEIIYKDLNQLMNTTTTKLRFPRYTPTGFRFSQGQIDYEIKDKADEEMIHKRYEEAKQQGREYFYLTGKTSKEMNGVLLNFENRAYKNGLRIMICQSLGLFGANAFSSDEKAEKMAITGREALLIDDKNEELTRIYVPDDTSGRRLVYEYEFQRDETLKKEVVKMIEDMFGDGQ